GFLFWRRHIKKMRHLLCLQITNSNYFQKGNATNCRKYSRSFGGRRFKLARNFRKAYFCRNRYSESSKDFAGCRKNKYQSKKPILFNLKKMPKELRIVFMGTPD